MSKRNVGIGIGVLVLIGAILAYGGRLPLGAQPTPTPFADQSELENLITASGTLLPAQRANLAFKVPGQVIQVSVKAGDAVKRGDALVRLDATDAEAAVAIAQANLDQLLAGPTEEEIRVAQANLETAQAQLAKVRAGPTAEDVIIARATLDRAHAALKDAQSAYDKVRDDPAVGMYPQSQALQAATQEYTIARARLQQVLKGSSVEDIHIAETTVASAQAACDRVKAGARPEEISAARARSEQAKAALAAMVLTAPFDGTIAAIDIKEGEIVSPGVPIATLGDLSQLRLETDDLSETNIARIQMAQDTLVTFEALPGKTFSGKVRAIAPISSQKQGGTNYTVTIEFDRLDPALRWGMTGHVEINAR